MLNISKGRTARALKVVCYGPEGVGKSSFAAQFPDPLFIDTENSTVYLDVRRIEGIATWEELIAATQEVAATPGICQTLVIDTADWAEADCVRYVCQKYHQNSIESFGYGKGYVYLGEEFGRLLAALDAVIAAGIHVVITAHAKMRKFEQPDEQGAYDRWEMKLTRHTAPLLKEWCDLLLFMNYKVYTVKTENDKRKAQGGSRVMYANHHPCWDAKNRQNLPDELPLDFQSIAHLFDLNPAPETESPRERLANLMRQDNVTVEQIEAVVVARGKQPEGVPLADYPDSFVTNWLLRFWPQIIQNIPNTPKK